jgi:hypothetical protein
LPAREIVHRERSGCQARVRAPAPPAPALPTAGSRPGGRSNLERSAARLAHQSGGLPQYFIKWLIRLKIVDGPMASLLNAAQSTTKAA